jgi:hypothetical protein
MLFLRRDRVEWSACIGGGVGGLRLSMCAMSMKDMGSITCCRAPRIAPLRAHPVHPWPPATAWALGHDADVLLNLASHIYWEVHV